MRADASDEHVPQIVTYIEAILARGLAYVAPDGVYFNVAAMGTRYGKLGGGGGGGPAAARGGAAAEGASAGAEVIDARQKRDPRDFALWKLAQPMDAASAAPSAGAAQWSSPWGLGRPGWHIECSAMSRAVTVLGPRFDLHAHAGGADLASPHHCNEIALTKAHDGLGLKRVSPRTACGKRRRRRRERGRERALGARLAAHGTRAHREAQSRSKTTPSADYTHIC